MLKAPYYSMLIRLYHFEYATLVVARHCHYRLAQTCLSYDPRKRCHLEGATQYETR
jgi:hypothetical protein